MLARIAAAAALCLWGSSASATFITYEFDHQFATFSNHQAGMAPDTPGGGVLQGWITFDDAATGVSMVVDYDLTSFLPGPGGGVWRSSDYVQGQTTTVTHPLLGAVTLSDSHWVLPHPTDPALQIVVLTDDRLDTDPSDDRVDGDNRLALVLDPGGIGGDALAVLASESYDYWECRDPLALIPDCRWVSSANNPTPMTAARQAAPGVGPGVSAVPLPGTLPLLLGGLAALGLRRRAV